MSNTTQTAEEFEKEHIMEFDGYYSMIEAYAKMKCLEQAENIYTRLDVFKAFEHGLDYGYHQGFSNASEDDPEYKELDTQEIFSEYTKDYDKQIGTMFSEDQMFLFAGYCMGKRLVNPEKDAKEIMEEWKADFNYKSL